jgi:galactokinase
MVYSRPFRISAPGRICLFGEHSDYLGLDVIAMAINMRIELTANPREDDLICVNYVDLGTRDEFPVGEMLTPRNKRDYLRSAFNVVHDVGTDPSHGWDLRVSGDIPIAGGLSSSSALSVAAVFAAGHMGGTDFNASDLARLAFEAEVERFGESGGMMDHFASAFGGTVHVAMTEEPRLTQLPAHIGDLVIGDSGEKKDDTVGDLRTIRKTVEAGYTEIHSKLPTFDRRTTPIQEVYGLSRSRPDKAVTMAEASLRNRDITAHALTLLEEPSPDPSSLGELLTEHHELLRDSFHRSTPKIERMVHASLDAGALGCKMNGSGGGGTMVAYAPRKTGEVATAIEAAGGTPYIVEAGQGATLTILRE